MRLKQAILTGTIAFCGSWAGAFADVPVAQAQAAAVCETVRDGVEYRAFLPDQRRFLYVSVKLLPGAFPTVFLIVDKNFQGKAAPKNDPMVAWWLDRKRPLRFSGDKVRIAWQDKGSFHFITGLFSAPATAEIIQAIPGLERQGNHFEGAGNDDTNVFAFQLRFGMPGFDASEFDVYVPAVSFDGVTVAPPPIHFNREDADTPAKC
jgi:hypothetical protein